MNKILVLCEGSNKMQIIDMLLDNDLLRFATTYSVHIRTTSMPKS